MKLFNHLKATMLPYCFTASSGIFMVAVELKDTSSFWILLCKNSSSTKTTDSRFFLYSWKYNRRISLFSISSALNTFLNTSMSALCEQWKTGRGRPRATKETLLLPLTKSPCARKFFFHCPLSVFFSFFFSFLCFGLLRQLSQICMVWLIWTLQKVWTRSPYVTNTEIIYFGRSFTWFTIAYIPNRCLFFAVYLVHRKENART